MQEVINSSYKKWKKVDLRTTRAIAHLCTRGVTFGTSTKCDIFAAMARKHSGYTKDVPKFVALMTEANTRIPKIKERYDTDVSAMLKEIEENYISKPQ